MKTRIILHHSLTKDSGTVSWSAIRKYHVATLGWQDIGYHYGIEIVGDIHEILLGRMVTDVAAAVREQHMNVYGIHICCVGNFDEAPPSGPLLFKLNSLLVTLCRVHHIPPKHIMGHRDYASYKTCPGTQFNIDLVRERVAAELTGY